MSIDHPIGTLSLTDCRISDSQRIGAVGEGFKLAMQTLETFRVSVGRPPMAWRPPRSTMPSRTSRAGSLDLRLPNSR